MRQMGRRIVFMRKIFLIFPFFAVLSCSPDKKAEEKEVAVAPAEASAEELVKEGLQKLSKWVNHWQAKGADLSFVNFTPNREINYEVIEWPGENPLDKDHPLKKYQIPHPKTGEVVDIYNYKVVIGDSGEIDFNPDAEVVYFKASGMRERLLFMGPSGLFEDAVWVDEKHLLVTGYFQKEDGYAPMVWLISPETQTHLIYESKFSTMDYSTESYLREKLSDLNFTP